MVQIVTPESNSRCGLWPNETDQPRLVHQGAFSIPDVASSLPVFCAVLESCCRWSDKCGNDVLRRVQNPVISQFGS
ncbi:MAG: hypothetical protein RIR87_1522 [Actinomycetota bacterium]